MALLFVWQHLQLTKAFVILLQAHPRPKVHCRPLTILSYSLLHVVSMMAAFWFAIQVLGIKSDTIVIFTPVCTDIGVFLGIAVDLTWVSCKAVLGKQYLWLGQIVHEVYGAVIRTLLTEMSSAVPVSETDQLLPLQPMMDDDGTGLDPRQPLLAPLASLDEERVIVEGWS